MQTSQFSFQGLVKDRVTGNIASAASSSAVLVQGVPDLSRTDKFDFLSTVNLNFGLLDRFRHARMSGHAQVIVGTPDGDGLFTPRVFLGEWEAISFTQNPLEDAVRMISFLFSDLLMEKVLVREEF